MDSYTFKEVVCCRIGGKLVCLHHGSSEFSVWGTMGCPFFLFCSDLDSRYVLPLVSFGVCSPQACLKRMLNKMQRLGTIRGAGGPSGPKNVRRLKQSNFSAEKSVGFKTPLFLVNYKGGPWTFTIGRENTIELTFVFKTHVNGRWRM